MSNVDFVLSHNLTLLAFFLYAWVSSSLVSVIGWGGDFKIRVRSYWAMGVFVLVRSNIDIVWQISLGTPLI